LPTNTKINSILVVTKCRHQSHINILLYKAMCFILKITPSGLLRPKHEALHYAIGSSCVDSDFMTANVCIVQTQVNVFCKLNAKTNINKNNNLKYRGPNRAIQHM
jgi:hypothetical protein